MQLKGLGRLGTAMGGEVGGGVGGLKMKAGAMTHSPALAKVVVPEQPSDRKA